MANQNRDIFGVIAPARRAAGDTSSEALMKWTVWRRRWFQFFGFHPPGRPVQ